MQQNVESFRTFVARNTFRNLLGWVGLLGDCEEDNPGDDYGRGNGYSKSRDYTT